jgi:hypothetical protein
MGAALAALLLVGCGGGGGGGAKAQLTGVASIDGTPAVYHAGALPAPHGALTVSVPSTRDVINGGSTQVTITASADIVEIYVGVVGSDGYYALTVPAGSSIAELLLTLAQLLPSELSLIFEGVDAAGDVSSPATLQASVTAVGTGDLQISVSWNVDNDLDLHVIDPNDFEIYYGDEESPEGGTLDLDSNAGCDPIDGVDNENVRWPTGTAPHGSYQVLIDNYQACTAAAVSYVVTIQKVGKAPQTFTGSFSADDVGDGGDVGAGKLVTKFPYP